MGFTDQVFGLILVTAGVGIAAYYTVWQFLSLPVLSAKHPIRDYFMDNYYLFKLPAFALIVGLLLIDMFISNTNRKIEAEKKRKEEAAKKQK